MGAAECAGGPARDGGEVSAAASLNGDGETGTASVGRAEWGEVVQESCSLTCNSEGKTDGADAGATGMAEGLDGDVEELGRGGWADRMSERRLVRKVSTWVRNKAMLSSTKLVSAKRMSTAS